MKNLLDSHTHTLASGHAYSTINDMAAAAKGKDLSLLAITEHAPAMPGSCSEIYFSNLRVLPRKRDGLWMLFGVELNILNRTGEVDLPEDLIRQLDVAIASIHPPCFAEEGTDAHMEACLAVMEQSYINIIGHPDDGRYTLDYRMLAESAAQKHKLLEINASSLMPFTYRLDAEKNYREMLSWCRKYGTHVIVNSDAHADCLVGEQTKAWELLGELDFPKELIVNLDLEQYFSYINYIPSERKN